MTSYDELIDLFLISVKDYRLDNLVNFIEELNFDILIKSENYLKYKTTCVENKLSPVKEYKYQQIVDCKYKNYEKYVDDSLLSFKIKIEGFIIRGLANFTNCKKDLSNRDDDLRQFKLALTDLEKSIIVDWAVLAWLDGEINDVRQITGMMQNGVEANRYSEANLLKEKTTHKVQLQEDVKQKQTDYSFDNIPWSDWARGNYGI